MRSGAVLYRFYGSDDELLYVGQSINFAARLSGHRATQAWFRDATTVTLEHFDSAADAKAAESSAIAAESPRFNRAGIAVERREPRSSGAVVTFGVRVPASLLAEYSALVAREERSVSQDIRLHMKRRVERARREQAARTEAAAA